MGAGVGSPFTCRDDPLNWLNTCAAQLCLFFAWWLTCAFAVSLVNRPPPKKIRDSLWGSRWKRRQSRLLKGKTQSWGPSSASTAPPDGKSRPLLGGWRGQCSPTWGVSSGLWTQTGDVGAEEHVACPLERRHGTPSSLKSGDWVSSQGVYQTLSFPSYLTSSETNYLGNLGRPLFQFLLLGGEK